MDIGCTKSNNIWDDSSNYVTVTIKDQYFISNTIVYFKYSVVYTLKTLLHFMEE